MSTLTRSQRWYYENKVDLQVKYNAPRVCDECGGKYTFINRSHHIKSKRHQQKIREKELNAEISRLRNELSKS